MKNTDMLRWMNGLDEHYLTECAALAETAKKKWTLRRVMPAAVAAAVAVVGLTATAVAIHDRSMLNAYFGEGGETMMESSGLPAAAVYENDYVRVTLDGYVNDGKQQLLLVTAEYFDGTPVEDRYQSMIYHENGELAYLNYSGSGIWSKNYQLLPELQPLSMDATAYMIPMTNHPSCDWNETYYMGFTPCPPVGEDEEELPADLFEGIRIPIRFEQNTSMETFVSADGDTRMLSCFEIYWETVEELGEREYTGLVGEVTLNDGSHYLLLSDSGGLNDSVHAQYEEPDFYFHHWEVYLADEVTQQRTEAARTLNPAEVKAITIDGVDYVRN